MFNKNKNNPGLPDKMQYHFEETKYGKIPCQSSYEERKFFKKLISEKPDNGTFVEIGIFGGINLFNNYDILNNKQWSIYGIDPHEKIEIFNGVKSENLQNDITNERFIKFKSFRENIEKIIKLYNLNIKYINNTSWNAYNIFDDKSIDILHIDGDHSFDGVLKDLELFYPKMKKDGYIIMDDYSWSCIRDAVNTYFNNKNVTKKEIFNGEKLIIKINN